jgi:hypothetical protein
MIRLRSSDLRQNPDNALLDSVSLNRPGLDTYSARISAMIFRLPVTPTGVGYGCKNSENSFDARRD